MVKLGGNLAEKLEKEQSMDDGFDNIPLITPLEVNQLQQPYLDKVTTCLILITLGFLACLVLLVMYKALWYDQLTCPEGFVLKRLLRDSLPLFLSLHSGNINSLSPWDTSQASCAQATLHAWYSLQRPPVLNEREGGKAFWSGSRLGRP
uniref:Calcyon neuron-specific vesicular protein n=1 Tax=Salmo trutta TaxID=8032 RepID=A0A674DP14_SALTR